MGFGVLQVMVLSVMGLNINWTVKTLKDVAAVEEIAEEVAKVAEVFEQNQQTVEGNAAKLEQNLQGFRLHLEVIEDNPPVDPIVIEGATYELRSREGKKRQQFIDLFRHGREL